MKRLGLLSIAHLIELGAWQFLTYRLHPSAPFWRIAVPRMAYLRKPL